MPRAQARGKKKKPGPAAARPRDVITRSRPRRSTPKVARIRVSPKGLITVDLATGEMRKHSKFRVGKRHAAGDVIKSIPLRALIEKPNTYLLGGNSLEDKAAILVRKGFPYDKVREAVREIRAQKRARAGRAAA